MKLLPIKFQSASFTTYLVPNTNLWGNAAIIPILQVIDIPSVWPVECGHTLTAITTLGV